MRIKLPVNKDKISINNEEIAGVGSTYVIYCGRIYAGQTRKKCFGRVFCMQIVEHCAQTGVKKYQKPEEVL